MKNLPYNPKKEDFKNGELSEDFIYNLYHDSDPTYTPIEYARLLIIADRLVRTTPIPVEEKPWERKGFCDNEGYCWVWRTDGFEESWVFLLVDENKIDFENSTSVFKFTHCLPHDAIKRPRTKLVELNLSFFDQFGLHLTSVMISVPVGWSSGTLVDEIKKQRYKLPITRTSLDVHYILVQSDNYPNGFILPCSFTF